VTTELVTSSSHRCASTLRAKLRACSLPAASLYRARHRPSSRLAILNASPCLSGSLGLSEEFLSASRADHELAVDRQMPKTSRTVSSRSVINREHGTLQRSGVVDHEIPRVWSVLCFYPESGWPQRPSRRVSHLGRWRRSRRLWIPRSGSHYRPGRGRIAVMADATRELAMFPLGSVLFPGMPLPLRSSSRATSRCCRRCSGRRSTSSGWC